MATVIPFPRRKVMDNPCLAVTGHPDPLWICIACDQARICLFFGKKTVVIEETAPAPPDSKAEQSNSGPNTGTSRPRQDGRSRQPARKRPQKRRPVP